MSLAVERPSMATADAESAFVPVTGEPTRPDMRVVARRAPAHTDIADEKSELGTRGVSARKMVAQPPFPEDRSREVPPYRKELLQQFEGTVLAVGSETFTARMRDCMGDGPDEVTEFELEEVAADERQFIVPGCIFYWNLGWVHWAYGQKMAYSEFVVRRFPVLTRKARKAMLAKETVFDELFEQSESSSGA